jgi:hypothetical protein
MWPANWGISNFSNLKTVDERRKAGNLLWSLCFDVKSAEQPGASQKNMATVFRRRFAACRCREHSGCGQAGAADVLGWGWALSILLVLRASRVSRSSTGGLQGGSSPKLYRIDHQRSVIQGYYAVPVRGEKRLTVTRFKLP